MIRRLGWASMTGRRLTVAGTVAVCLRRKKLKVTVDLVNGSQCSVFQVMGSLALRGKNRKNRQQHRLAGEVKAFSRLRIGDQMDERFAWNEQWCELSTSTLLCRM